MVAVNIRVNRMVVVSSRNKGKCAGGRNEELEEEVVGFGQWLLPAISGWFTVNWGNICF
jgi:hypothetical protein